MKNLLQDHPDEEVRAAAIRLLDALCTWERGTGRKNLVIIKDGIGCEYRSLSGSPVPATMMDEEVVEAYRSMP